MSSGDENKQDHQQRNIVLMCYQIFRTSLKEMYACEEGELEFSRSDWTGFYIFGYLNAKFQPVGC